MRHDDSKYCGIYKMTKEHGKMIEDAFKECVKNNPHVDPFSNEIRNQYQCDTRYRFDILTGMIENEYLPKNFQKVLDKYLDGHQLNNALKKITGTAYWTSKQDHDEMIEALKNMNKTKLSDCYINQDDEYTIIDSNGQRRARPVTVSPL